VELGDRVTVTGTIDNDSDDGEAAELNADSIAQWKKDD